MEAVRSKRICLLYPGLKLSVEAFQDHFNHFLQNNVEGLNPDPVFVRFWEKMRENPSKYMVDNAEQHMECLQQPNHYLISTETIMAQRVSQFMISLLTRV